MRKSSSDYKNDGFEADDTPYFVSFQAGSSNDSPRTSNTQSETSIPPEIRYNDSKSHMIIEVPVSQMRKIQSAEGTVSAKRETQHFCETTTMHGPKRVFKGKRWATLFWAIMVSCSLGLLITQVVILVKQYVSKPTVSDVSFLINDDGMDFPLVTFCNLNPVRKTYIENMNKTGDVNPDMINYLMFYFTEIQFLLGGTDRATLHTGNDELKQYQKNHPNFTADSFFMDAGFECNEVMKLCSFQGEIFDCCSIAEDVLTPLGKCYTLDLSRSKNTWMHKQTEPGIQAGLQVTLDAHLEEQFDGENDSIPPLFTNSFVDGFRYFVHPQNTIPHLSSDEFTVSPNSVAYSAIQGDRFVLLNSDEWGNCTTDYPSGISTQLPYTSSNCLSLCKAKYFFENCGCSPALYNIDNQYQECSPFETYTCVDNVMRKKGSNQEWEMPVCNQCNAQCNSLVFRAYNSYGSRFSAGALNWLNKRNSSWTVNHMKSNFQMVNVFYRDMSYTEYQQVQDASITQLLSDIGGNMGMFLGMSVITITEICLFFSKIFWIGLSKRRRDYMYSKKQNEKNYVKDIDETVEKMKVIGSTANLQNLVRISTGANLKDMNDNENVQFRINLQDLASQIDNPSAYIRTEIDRSRSNTAKY